MGQKIDDQFNAGGYYWIPYHTMVRIVKLRIGISEAKKAYLKCQVCFQSLQIYDKNYHVVGNSRLNSADSSTIDFNFLQTFKL